ncbi:MAG: hypothetical protein QOJ72_1520 [Nocardioidaceae bacterium]|nr:hypothetical protein [Nocardioidaceae bacterium]
MTRDGSSEHTIDPAQRWAQLLEGLHGRRREAVLEALRASDEQGFPATAEGVRILVAYALGKISARQYAARILDSLGLVPPPPERSHPTSTFDPLPDLGTWRTDERRPRTWQEPERSAPKPEPAPWTPVSSRAASREEAVHAFLSGRIPVEEFLRLSRVRTV